MAYFTKCQYCGGNLDPGEKCDCKDETEIKKKKIQEMLRSGKHGQIAFNFTKKDYEVEKKII